MPCRVGFAPNGAAVLGQQSRPPRNGLCGLTTLHKVPRITMWLHHGAMLPSAASQGRCVATTWHQSGSPHIWPHCHRIAAASTTHRTPAQAASQAARAVAERGGATGGRGGRGARPSGACCASQCRWKRCLEASSSPQQTVSGSSVPTAICSQACTATQLRRQPAAGHEPAGQLAPPLAWARRGSQELSCRAAPAASRQPCPERRFGRALCGSEAITHSSTCSSSPLAAGTHLNTERQLHGPLVGIPLHMFVGGRAGMPAAPPLRIRGYAGRAASRCRGGWRWRQAARVRRARCRQVSLGQSMHAQPTLQHMHVEKPLLLPLTLQVSRPSAAAGCCKAPPASPPNRGAKRTTAK